MTTQYENLPAFPTLYNEPDCPLTEECIDYVVERLMDRADKRLTKGEATQEDYDAWVEALDAWATEQMAKTKSLAHR
jgi:hypothetical protein